MEFLISKAFPRPILSNMIPLARLEVRTSIPLLTAHPRVPLLWKQIRGQTRKKSDCHTKSAVLLKSCGNSIGAGYYWSRILLFRNTIGPEYYFYPKINGMPII